MLTRFPVKARAPAGKVSASDVLGTIAIPLVVGAHWAGAAWSWLWDERPAVAERLRELQAEREQVEMDGGDTSLIDAEIDAARLRLYELDEAVRLSRAV